MKPKQSNFASEQLKKFGWKEGMLNNIGNFGKMYYNQLKRYFYEKIGDGIGKSNQGMVNPIKATFKFDNSGVRVNKKLN